MSRWQPADLSWLDGRWLMCTPNGEIAEEWTATPSGYLGVDTYGKGGEVLRIDQSEGKTSLVVVTRLQSVHRYELTSSTARSATFENARDYPAKVLFGRDGDVLTIETSGGFMAGLTFLWRNRPAKLRYRKVAIGAHCDWH